MNNLYQNVSGKSRDEYEDYLKILDRMDWKKYDYKTWPCADLSFEDLDEDEDHDVWPFKPNVKEPHWVDLNNQFPDGIRRRGYAEGFKMPEEVESMEFDDAQECFNDLLEVKEDDPENFQSELEDMGFKNEYHLLWAMEILEDSSDKAYAAADDFLKGQQEILQDHMAGQIKNAQAGGLLDPIEGIDMDTWAAANAKIANGSSLEELLPVLGLEKPTWDKVSAEWMARMSQDTTYAITTVYGQAFVNSNIGKFAENMASSSKASDVNPTGSNVREDFDLYIKVMCHMNMGVTQGKDPSGILAEYGLNVADWGSVGGEWSMKMATNTKLAMQMGKLMEKYNAEFASAGVADDINF